METDRKTTQSNHTPESGNLRVNSLNWRNNICFIKCTFVQMPQIHILQCVVFMVD